MVTYIAFQNEFMPGILKIGITERQILEQRVIYN